MSSSTQDFSLIKNVLDKYFDFRNEKGWLSYQTELIPESMLAPGEGHKERSRWLPIPGTVDDDTIRELENLLGHQLPESYKFFLCYCHFVDLSIGGYPTDFFKNLPGKLVSNFRELKEEGYADLFERNYIPFADYSDLGLVCFDTTNVVEGNDYPVVWLAHEDGYAEAFPYAKNFLDLFLEFEKDLND